MKKPTKSECIPLLNKTVGRLIIETGKRILDGSCSLKDDEMLALMKLATHEELNLAQLESRFNVCQKTIERWCSDGTLPPLRKDKGGKKFLWHDEVELWIMNHGSPL